MKKLSIRYSARRLKPGQFRDEIRNKISVFLHHTVGSSWLEAVDWWNQTEEAVGTALGVERNGDALQAFEINRWAFHLGDIKGATGKTTRESVGIELISWGYLFKEKDKEGKDVFVAYPLFPLKHRRIVIPENEVCELDKPWRGYKYWHKYTDEQVETTVQLCRYLVDRFKIKVQDLTNFWEYREDVMKKDLPGIWAHSTVRKDKTDIFPQPNLIKALYKEFGTKTNP